jgi:hypothetical protein
MRQCPSRFGLVLRGPARPRIAVFASLRDVEVGSDPNLWPRHIGPVKVGSDPNQPQQLSLMWPEFTPIYRVHAVVL